MARLGSKENPLILNLHDEKEMLEICGLCHQMGWHYIMGMNPTEPVDLHDLVQKMNPPTVQYAELKTGRNDACPCGSEKKFKKCCENLEIEDRTKVSQNLLQKYSEMP